MKIVPLVRAEFARLTASRLGKLSLAAIMVVPIVYGGLYLWGNQDPYSNLDKVPAALVVADTGATVDKKAVNYGEDAAKNLLDDGTFGWHEVSAAEAAAGVDNGTYDFALTFPASFSSDLSSAADDDPTRAQLVLTTNDTNSYLSTTLAKQAAATVRTTIATSVGEKATDTLLTAVSDIRDGFVDASDGATKLADGATDAASGATTLANGTSTLASGAAELSAGAATLSDGASDLAAGTKKVSGGAADLSDGASSLASGAKTLSTGLATLDSSTSGLPASAAALSTGASQVATGAASAATGAAALQAGTQQLADLSPQVQAQVKSVFAAYGVPASTSTPILTELAGISSGTASVDTGVDSLASGLGTLKTGAAAVSTGASTLSTSAPKLADAVHSAATGASKLSKGAKKLASGASTLSTGAKSASTGASKLANGAQSASDGASSLAAGATKVDDGAHSLATGTGTLSTGATKLSDSLASGLGDIPATTDSSRTDTAAAVADPLSVKQNAVTEAANYGAGLAPFFISLSSWIGIYALFLLIRPLSRRALTAVRRPVRTMLAGWATPALLGAVQMVALFAVVTLALHLTVANGFGLVLFMAFVAITFAAIVLALNVLFGSVGQFLGLILMIVQLVTAGGTFPWQTLPAPLAALHYALPMGHAVDGVRQLMYGGSSAAVWTATWPLIIWLFGALALATYGAAKQGRLRTLRELRPSAIGG